MNAPDPTYISVTILGLFCERFCSEIGVAPVVYLNEEKSRARALLLACLCPRFSPSDAARSTLLERSRISHTESKGSLFALARSMRALSPSSPRAGCHGYEGKRAEVLMKLTRCVRHVGSTISIVYGTMPPCVGATMASLQ